MTDLTPSDPSPTRRVGQRPSTSKALAAEVKKRESAISARDDRIQQLQQQNEQLTVELQIALSKVAELDDRRREVFAAGKANSGREIDAMTTYMEELSQARRQQEDAQIPSQEGPMELQELVKPKLAHKAVQTERLLTEQITPQLVQELREKFEVLKVEQAKRLSENEAITHRRWAQMSAQAEHVARAVRAPEPKTPKK